MAQEAMSFNDFKHKLDSYSGTIEQYQKQIEKAKQDKLVAETNIENYRNQLNDLEAECQSSVGCSLKELPERMEAAMNEIEKAIAQIEAITPAAVNGGMPC